MTWLPLMEEDDLFLGPWWAWRSTLTDLSSATKAPVKSPKLNWWAEPPVSPSRQASNPFYTAVLSSSSPPRFTLQHPRTAAPGTPVLWAVGGGGTTFVHCQYSQHPLLLRRVFQEGWKRPEWNCWHLHHQRCWSTSSGWSPFVSLTSSQKVMSLPATAPGGSPNLNPGYLLAANKPVGVYWTPIAISCGYCSCILLLSSRFL